MDSATTAPDPVKGEFRLIAPDGGMWGQFLVPVTDEFVHIEDGKMQVAVYNVETDRMDMADIAASSVEIIVRYTGTIAPVA